MSPVAVAVVNWNSGDLLARCLDALARQTQPASRVIVVDNGSTDGSEAPARDGRGLQLLSLGRNTGFAAACNRALEAAAGCDWVALLNPDAFPEPGWLEALSRAAAEHPGHSFFASRQLAAESPGRLDGTGDVYAVSGLAWRRDHGRAAAGRRLAREEVFAPCAAAALYRADALAQAGGFDESFFCYFEDVDLAFRLRLLGHRCLYVPEAVVHHVGSALAGRGSDFAVYHGHRNLVWTWVKCMPRGLLLRHWPQHAAVTLASLVHFSARGQARAILAAKRDALRQLPRALRQRRAVHRGCRVAPADLQRLMVRGVAALGVGRR
jgi:GT2 family glycosyltransferase